jgi:hypothetical protein
MDNPIRPEWAPVLEVLPTYVGGYLEWNDPEKKLQCCAKIEKFGITERTLEIHVAWAFQRVCDATTGRHGAWEPERYDPIVGPTTSWVVHLANSICTPTVARDNGEVSFTLLNFVFAMHPPGCGLARELDQYHG